MVLRSPSLQPRHRPRITQREPRYLREYADTLQAMGEAEFRARYAAPVLVGVAMMGELVPHGGGGRRTHNVEGESEYIPVQSLLDRVWRLTTGPNPLNAKYVTVGSSSECDVVVPDYSLSARHVSFTRTRPMKIADLGSLNGTKCNGEALPPRRLVKVHCGDELLLGRLVLRYLDGQGFLEALTSI